MNIEVYRHILKVYGRDPGQWFGFLAAIIRTLTIRVYLVVIIAEITSKVAAGDIAGAKGQMLQFFLVYVIGTVIGAAGELVATHTENKQYYKVMLGFYQKLINKDIAFYRDNQTGYLASVFRQYLDGMITLIRFFRGGALAEFMSLIIPPIVLFLASPTIGLVAIGVVAIQFIYIIWSSAKANHYRLVAQEAYRKVTGEVSDEITNIIAFKSGGFEDRAQSKVAAMGRIENQAYILRRRMITLLDLPRNLITACGVSLAVYLIISPEQAASPESLGLIVLTITYMFQIVKTVNAVPELITTHDDLITKVGPTLKYLHNDHEQIRDPDEPLPFNISRGEVRIEGVDFGYPSQNDGHQKIPVFTDLNLTLAGGEQVGVVGLSGAGKSTLANLLLRFDEVDAGSITIDGINIRSVRQSELRKHIAYVPQEPLLFHTSIKENIKYYNPDVDDAEMIRAATAAHAHEFVDKLPDGYDTIVGERGIKLSGGQKQRVAIARAILKKAPIMIFDEATSALDSESEQIIQRALPEIIGKQTALVVAHRLSTVAGLDRIIVMHEGKVVEQGTHKELLKLKGRYYSLWQKQTKEFSSGS
jgi:ATP-binding cassette, subfamily B, bacterial